MEKEASEITERVVVFLLSPAMANDRSGYLITDANGRLFGKVATARLSSEELARQRRAEFQLIRGDKTGQSRG